MFSTYSLYIYKGVSATLEELHDSTRRNVQFDYQPDFGSKAKERLINLELKGWVSVW